MVIIISMTLPLSGGLIIAQEDSPPETACAFGRKESPLVGITFDRVEKGDGYEDILFRLTNDSACSLVLETHGRQFVAGRLESSPELQDGAGVGIDYVLEEHESGERSAPFAPGGCCRELQLSVLHAGRSVTFRVPVVTLRREFDVIVPYRFAGEKEKWRMTREAYFRANDLPEYAAK
jgi:hypothetical protein